MWTTYQKNKNKYSSDNEYIQLYIKYASNEN